MLEPTSDYTTRHPNTRQLSVPIARTNKAFFPSAIMRWNGLSFDTSEINSVATLNTCSTSDSVRGIVYSTQCIVPVFLVLNATHNSSSLCIICVRAYNRV